jgi:serine/threonine protein kinase
VKTIHLLKLKHRARDVLEEMFFMRSIRHPQILNITKIYKEDEKLMVITPYFKGKNLKAYLKSDNRLTERQIGKIVKQILEITRHLVVEGVQTKNSYFNDQNSKNSESEGNRGIKYLHRDLKIENFVVDPDTLDITMIDYGIMSQFPTVNDLKKNLQVSISLPPESLKGEYQLGCEAWSIGVITHQLLTGKPPYSGKTTREMFHNVVNGINMISELKDYSDQAYDFIINLLGPQV